MTPPITLNPQRGAEVGVVGDDHLLVLEGVIEDDVVARGMQSDFKTAEGVVVGGSEKLCDPR